MTNSKWLRLARKSLALLLTGILASCGGGDEGDNRASPLPPSPVGAVTVVDGFGAVRPDTAARVDLSAFVRGPGATLTALESVQPECRAAKLSGLMAEVTVEGGGLCQYAFTASNGASDASASLNVLASSKASPVLPPLSQAMTLSGSSATYDLQALLGADWPSGYSLDTSSLQVQGGSVQGTAAASGNRITYTPPATPDWNRIVFILKDPSRPTEDALGTLYITVSDEVNQAPVIGKPKYDYATEVGASVVTFEGTVLDLAILPALGISDPEGGDWQLVEVQSYSASVAPVDPSSVTNRQFTFTAGTVGTHIVSYIVGDHHGGFTMGLMNVTVGPKERGKNWVDIVVGNLTFFATPLHSEVSSRAVTAEGLWDSGVNLAVTPPGNTIAGVNGAGARSYCGSLGYRLATNANLNTLRTTPAAGAERAKYPAQRDYLVSSNSGDGFVAYNLTSGATTYVPSTASDYYVMCVKYADDKKMIYTPRANTPLAGYVNTAISDGVTWQTLGDVVSDGGIGGLELTSITDVGSNPLSGENFRLSPAGCAGGTCTLEAFADPTEYGAGTVRLINAVESGKAVDVNPVTFWQPVRLAALRTGTDFSQADGVAQNTVIATLKDSNGDPVPANTKVRLDYGVTPAADVTLDPPSHPGGTVVTTNGLGEVSLALSYRGAASQFTFLLQPVVGGLKPSNSFSANLVFIHTCEPLLTNADLTFTCPLMKAEADANGIAYGSVALVDNTGIYNPAYAMFIKQTYSQAITYCNNLGNGYRLPTLSELQALYIAKGNMYSNHLWPSSHMYWSSTPDSTNNKTLWLSNGTIGTQPLTREIFVSCVRSGS